MNSYQHYFMDRRGLCRSCIHQKGCKYYNKDINKGFVANCHKYIPDYNYIFYQMIKELHFDEVED